MKILNKIMKIVMFLLIVLVQFTLFVPEARAVIPPDLGLGTADSYAVFGAAGVANSVRSTHIWGDVGADSSVLGLNDATQVDGTIKVAPATNGVAADASSTYDSLMDASQGVATRLDLSGLNTIGPGVYMVTGTTLDSTLTLDGPGVYIFQSSSSNAIPHSGVMNLINGATACNVFWAVADSISIGTGAQMVGTIIAQTGSVTMAAASILKGRAISLVGTVTLDSNQITEPICNVAMTASGSTSLTGISVTTGGGGAAAFCETLNEQVVPPSVIESRRIDSTSIFLSWAPYSGLDMFNVEYGTRDGSWLYNTDVTGFSTTLNNLPPNQPIWVRVAARSTCTIGDYGQSKLVGGPGLPNAGFNPHNENILWFVGAGVFVILSVLLRRKFIDVVR